MINHTSTLLAAIQTMEGDKEFMRLFIKNLEIETGGEDISEFVVHCMLRARGEKVANYYEKRAAEIRRRQP